MPVITLPDGSQRTFSSPVSVYDVAAEIGPGLAKAMLAGKVNEQLVDASYVMSEDAALAIITDKNEEGLEIIRHSAAHLLAQAIKQLYPAAQITIGPVIDDGFFYDIDYAESFGPDDIEKIEKKMEELAKEDFKISRSTKSRDDAVKFFRALGEEYKAQIIEDIPADQELSLYTQGEFTDLCRGPHVPSTGKIKAFKLTKLAGAYWRGDSNNKMLQRIYGTAWPDKKQLSAYLKRIEEAEKRDHRKIGKQLGLFHTQEEAPGMVFWHKDGWDLNLTIKNYIRNRLRDHDYQEINTPQVVDRSLWERSGHWDKFSDMMFTTHSESRDYAVKPMNCPCHIQVFNQGLKSYRDLPLRLAEFGSCHRNEPSGTLHGLMRVRNFVQDDAHIFCTEDQLQDEVSDFIDLTFDVYKDFGFENIEIALSTRPEQRVGSDEVWDLAEKSLADALDAKGIKYKLQPGEGAFYGPKIEFTLKDCLERGWQCGTMQVDFSMPGRLDAQYVAEDGNRKVPVMLHRAILGSVERFIGILIEHYEGKFPLWLSPQHAVIMNITDKQADFAKIVEENLHKRGFKVKADLRNEKVGFKIREHTLQRVPYMLVIGDRELENQSVAVRSRSGEDLGSMSVDAFADHLAQTIKNHGLAI